MNKRSLFRPRSSALALEPRILFDGAAATAVDDHTAVGQFDGHQSAPQETRPAPAVEATAANPVPTTAPATLLVIDSRVADYQSLLSDLPANTMVRVIDAGESGIDAINSTIASSNFESIQIISHGSSGSLTLGSDTIDNSTLSSQSAQIQTWAPHLTANADILLYGCDIGAGPNGTALLTQLATLTGADIAASIDATGAAAKGGDWLLEQQTGQIDSRLIVSDAALMSYNELLAAPVNNVPAAQSVAEDNSITFGAGNTISVADTDGSVQSVAVSVTHGLLTLASTTGLTLTGNGTSSITITAGTIANINAALNGLVYRPAANYAGDDSLTIVTNDGSSTDTDSVAITVTPNATAPVLTLPTKSQTVVEDTPSSLDFTGTNAIVLTDADVNDLQTLTLSVTHGTLNISVTGGASIIGGNGTGSVVLSGTAAQLSATLASASGVQYTPDLNYNSTAGPEALSFNLNDGQHTQTGSVALNVTPVNDAPTISGGSPLSVAEGGTTVFSAAVTVGSGFTQSQLGLADVDTSAVQATIKIAGLPLHGILRVNGSPVTIGSTLSVADIDQLSYTHDGSQVTIASTDTFLLTVDDGAGGLLTDQTVTVNLTPVNQPPSVSGTITVIEGETDVRLDLNDALPTLGTARGAISVSDPEGAAITTYNITSLPTHGTLYYNGVAILSASVGTPFVVLDKTLLTYSHDGSETRSDSFNMSVTDNGGGTGTPASASGTIDLNIYPNDDDPILATDIDQTMPGSGASLSITPGMLQVTDVDSSNVEITYTVVSVPNPADGYFTLRGEILVAGASFTQDDIDQGRLIYVNDSIRPRTDSITFTVKDSGQRIYPTVRDGGIYDAGTDSLTVNTFNITIPPLTPPDGGGPPPELSNNIPPIIFGTNTLNLYESETKTLTTSMLLAADVDNIAAELIYRVHSLPSSGSVRLNGTALLVNQTFTQADVNSGQVSFAHAGDEDFIDAFTYTVSDGKNLTAVQTFNITTTPQNDTPSATIAGTGLVVSEGGSFAVIPSLVALSDRDNSTSDNETGYAVDNVLSFRITGSVTHGTLKLNGVDVIAGTTVVTAAQLAAGNLVYAHDSSENYTDAFRLVPVDDQGIITGTATNQISTGAEVDVPITIYPVNDAPSYFSKSQLIAGQAGAIQEGATATIGGASSYSGGIPGLTGSGAPTASTGAHLVFGDNDNSSVQRQYRVNIAPLNGLLLLNGTALGVGSVFTQNDLDSGRIAYKHDGSETSTDSFSYVISDGDFIVNDTTVYPQDTPRPSIVSSTYLIEITPRNDVPTLTAPTSLDAFAAGAGTTAISGVTLADLDLKNGVSTGETDFVRVEVQVLDNANMLVAAAQLNFTAANPTDIASGGPFNAGKGTNFLIVQGTKAEVDAILNTLTVAFSADADASDYKIRITADDRLYNNTGALTTGANGGPGPLNADGTDIDASNNRVTKDIVLRASNFNDPPAIINASAFTVNEDAQVTLSGFVVTDADSFGNDITVTVQLYSDAGRTTLANAGTQGALILGATTGLTSFSGNNSNTITLTGSLSEVQAALNDLKFGGAVNYNGTGVGNGALYLRTTIADFNHADGQKTATVDNTITIVPVNDQPTLSVPGNQVMSSGASISISSGFAVGDVVDISQGAAVTDYVEVTVAATLGGASYGTISVTPGGAVVDSNGTAIIVVKGSTTDVQTALNTLIYTPTSANVDSTVVITTTIDDRTAGVGNGVEGTGVDGNNTNTRAFNINISNINDAPVLSAPLAVTATEDLTFSFTGSNQISIADSDDFGAVEQVTLDLGASPKGTITLSTITGLTFTIGDGTADTVMVFTGTKAAINAALATLTFTPTANSNTVGDGNRQSLSITVDDQGNTGFGGSLTDSETVLITINPVNDAPTRTAATTSLAAVPEDSSAPSGNTVSSLFTGVFSDLTDTQTGGSTANPLAGVAIVGNAATAAQGKWQYNSGAGWTDLPTAPSLVSPFLLKTTDQVRFLPTGNWNGTPGQLTVRLIDASSGAVTSGAGPDLSGAATGGTTAYSDAANAVTLSTSVTAVNDAPIASGTATLDATFEDATDPAGALISALIPGTSYSDATDTVTGGSSATPLGGVAIVGNTADATTQGVWQYSTNGGASWVAVPTSGLGDANALVLPTTAMLRFVPVANFNGVPGGLAVRLSDSPQGFNASTDISSAIGTTGTWSATSIPIATTVDPRNDAPTIAGTVTTLAYTEQLAPLALITGGSASDIDLPGVVTFGGGTLTITLDNYRTGDVLTLSGSPAGVASTSGGNASALVINLNTAATPATLGAILEAIRFANTGDDPTGHKAGLDDTDRAFSITLNDGNNVNGTANAGGPTSLDSNILTGTFTVTPVNDPPVAVDDTNSITEDTATVSGDVKPGTAGQDSDIDNTDAQLSLSGIRTGTESSGDPMTHAINVGTTSADGTDIGGLYGNLRIGADGTYTYTLDNNNPTVNALKGGDTLTEVFTYTLIDPGPLTDTAQLTITINGRTDGPPSITPVDGNGAALGEVTVNESGLTSGGDTSETNTGSLTLAAADGLASVSVGGTAVTLAQLNALGTTPINITTAEGMITLTGFTPGTLVGGVPTTGTLNYSYTLTQVQNTPAAIDNSEAIALAITDAGGTTAAGTLTVRIVDDVPTANADTNSVNEGTTAAATSTTGNVFAIGSGGDVADRLGADIRANPVTAVAFGVNLGSVGTALAGAYGSLTLNGDGSYTYAVDNTNATVNALGNGQSLTEIFTYTLTDNDGDNSPATLTITINGVDDGSPSITPVDGNGAALGEVTVNESGLTSGGDTSETNTGSLTLAAADGLASVSVGGTAVTLAQLNALGTTPISITTAEGVITLTGFTPGTLVGGVPTTGTLSYSYTLTQVQNTPAAIDNSEAIALAITDAGGTTAAGTLTVRIVDDVPTANADTNSVNEGTTAAATSTTGNVFAIGSGGDVADRLGADVRANPVTAVAFGVNLGSVGTALAGAYGSLTLNGDGSYTYAVDNTNATVNALGNGQSLTEIFTYTLTDNDGDNSPATLTITINGVDDGSPSITPVDGNGAALGEVTVNESGLTSGGDTSETNTGSLTLAAADGLASVSVGGTAVTLAQLNALGTTPISITTAEGVITLTGFTPGTLVGGVPTTGTLSYSYTLTQVQNTPAAIDNSEAIALAITDAGGTTAAGTLTVRIVDDVPTANADTNSVNEGTTAAATSTTGNVFAIGSGGDVADRLGADVRANPVTAVAFGVNLGSVGTALAGAYGSLTLNGDGSYTYAVDNTNATVNALGNGQSLTEIFTYTLTDNDGDNSPATLTITINGRNDPPDAVNDGILTILEDTPLNNIPVLGNDTDPEGDPLTVTSATVPAAQGSVSINADGTLNYDPALHFNGTAVITYTISDGNGGTDTATVTINVGQVNDPPVAVNDSGHSPDGRSVTVAVLANDTDVEGDTLTVTGIAGIPLAPGGSVTIPEGTVTLNADGTLTFAPNPGVQGSVVFPYTISDGHGGTATANVTITVVPAPTVTAPEPAPPLPPSYRLFGDQTREPSVYFAGDLSNGIIRLPIPFDPAVYVHQAVSQAQQERMATDGLSFSNPNAVRFGAIQSHSIGAGLGLDPALFVQPAVRDSQAQSEWIDNLVDGRLIRVSLSNDRLIPTPDLSQPNPLEIVPPTKIIEISGANEGVGITENQMKAEGAASKMATGSSRAIQRSAPSFSEQLRASGGQVPIAAGDVRRLHSNH